MRFIIALLWFVLCAFYVYTEEIIASEGQCDSESCQDDEELFEKVGGDVSNPSVEEINVVITFYNAISNQKLIKTFTKTVSSLLEHTSVPIAIHILGDKQSQDLAVEILSENNHGKKFRVSVFRELSLENLRVTLLLDRETSIFKWSLPSNPRRYFWWQYFLRR